MDVSLALADPQLAEIFTVLRSEGQFSPGGWQDTKKELTMSGVIGIAQARDLDMLPEGDLVMGAITIHTRQALFVTHENGSQQPGTSDIVVWQGEKYRIYSVYPYGSRGFFWALAARMSGS